MDVRYYRICSRFWSDEKVLGWDDDTRLLALYLLTCPHRTAEGLFRLPKPYIMADLQWLPERLGKPFAQLLADGFLAYDETVSVALLRQALKYQQPANPNQEKAAIRHLEELPQTLLLQDFILLAERFAQRFAKRLRERFAQRFAKPQALTQALTQAQDREDHGPTSPTSTPPPPAPVQPPGDPQSEPYRLAVFLRAEILARDATTRVPDEGSGAFRAWVVTADRMLRLDERPAREAARLIRWAQRDEFWCANILSMAKLRKQYDTLKRQMERAPGPNGRPQKTESAAARRLRELEEAEEQISTTIDRQEEQR